MQVLFYHLHIIIDIGQRTNMILISPKVIVLRTREPGVLILSPFAGAGGMMHEALLVNPYEVALANPCEVALV